MRFSYIHFDEPLTGAVIRERNQNWQGVPCRNFKGLMNAERVMKNVEVAPYRLSPDLSQWTS
jgi:hypothetical protein